jgi:hypothetical protein
MMRRVVELEKTEKEPGYLELFKGTDCYRTLIVCGAYAAQNLTGNLIANQAVYFFKRKLYAPRFGMEVCTNHAQRPALGRIPRSP